MDLSTWGAAFHTALAEMASPGFWVSVLQIIWINILLSGDNAVVIALACRGLPARQRMWGMILGAGVAVLLRVAFTGIIAHLMLLPYLKLVGGLALLYIAVKLLVPDDADKSEVEAVRHLWRAVRIVAVADIVMSLDNVIAIAAAAQGSTVLLIFGLGVSIPLIVAGASLIMALLDRFPIVVWAGAAVLGWVAGQVCATDPIVAGYLTGSFGAGTAHHIELASAAAGTILVLVVGGVWRRARSSAQRTASDMVRAKSDTNVR